MRKRLLQNIGIGNFTFFSSFLIHYVATVLLFSRPFHVIQRLAQKIYQALGGGGGGGGGLGYFGNSLECRAKLSP